MLTKTSQSIVGKWPDPQDKDKNQKFKDKDETLKDKERTTPSRTRNRQDLLWQDPQGQRPDLQGPEKELEIGLPGQGQRLIPLHETRLYRKLLTMVNLNHNY